MFSNGPEVCLEVFHHRFSVLSEQLGIPAVPGGNIQGVAIPIEEIPVTTATPPIGPGLRALGT